MVTLGLLALYRVGFSIPIPGVRLDLFRTFHAPFAGGHAADHVRAVFQHPSEVERAVPACYALYQNFRFFVYQDAHKSAFRNSF